MRRRPRRDLAARRVWGTGSVWVAEREAPPALTAAAEVPGPPAQVVNHYHIHLPPGTDLSGLTLALPPGDTETREEQ